MKRIFFSAALFGLSATTMIHAQVGINTDAPKATLDVAAKATNGTTAEGIILPRLTGDQLKAADAMYAADQTGAMVYATSAPASPSTKTANVTAAGYYYFDGTKWVVIRNAAPVSPAAGSWTQGGTNSTVATSYSIPIYHENFVGIGTSGTNGVDLPDNFSPASGIDLISADNNGLTNDLNIRTYSTDAGIAPDAGTLLIRSYRGTYAAPANLAFGDKTGNIYFGGRVNNAAPAGNLSSIETTYLGDGTTALSSMAFRTSSLFAFILDQNNNVGIGTSYGLTGTAGSRLEIDGAATNKASATASGSAVDFTKSNLAKSSAVNAAYTLSGLKDGGTYTLAEQENSTAAATLSASGFTVKMSDSSGSTSGQRVYTIVVIGTVAYVYVTLFS